MMNHRGILITFRALTHAQRGARLLERSGCPASVLRPPQELATGQCGYAVRIPEGCLREALRQLTAQGLLEGKVYRRQGDGYEVIRS